MSGRSPSVSVTPPPAALVVGSCPVSPWFVDPAERLRRQLRAQGITDLQDDPAEIPDNGSVIVVRADIAYDPALMRALAETPGLALLMPDRDEVAAVNVPCGMAADILGALAAGRLTREEARKHGLDPQLPDEAASAYRTALRKREPPYLLRIRRDNRLAVERRLYSGAYKGVTDLVTKYVWPEPAFWVTRVCARLGISPNMVTFASLLLVIAAFYFFAQGQFALGLLAGWAMTFLDTVDGKLARVTVTHSRLGNVFDHGIDLVHPPFWYWAWMMGLQATGQVPADASLLLAVIVGGYVLQRVEEGVFIARHGVEMHVWRRFDSYFRLITARRNPNLIILTVSLLFGHPDVGIVLVAWWTALCFAVHLVRMIQAESTRRHGRLTSWLSS